MSWLIQNPNGKVGAKTAVQNLLPRGEIGDFDYSNSSFTLVTLAAEKATGVSWLATDAGTDHQTTWAHRDGVRSRAWGIARPHLVARQDAALWTVGMGADEICCRGVAWSG
jgi:hypothetical protein